MEEDGVFAELNVEKNEILYDFKNKEMVTLTVNKNTATQFDYV